jgi:hypothetical protein
VRENLLQIREDLTGSVDISERKKTQKEPRLFLFGGV